MSYLEDAAAEVRAMLDANTRREQFAIDNCEDRHGPVRAGIREERLLIIDRLIAIARTEAGVSRDAPPEAGGTTGSPA